MKKVTESMLLVLRKINGVEEVTSTMNSIRVYTKNLSVCDRIRKRFGSLEFKILDVKERSPTVEDAFIYVTEVRE